MWGRNFNHVGKRFSVASTGYTGGCQPKVGVLIYYFALFFAENCMKIKEFGPQVGRVPGAPLDSPMLTVQTGNYLLLLSAENIAMVTEMLGRIRDGMDPFILSLIF